MTITAKTKTSPPPSPAAEAGAEQEKQLLEDVMLKHRSYLSWDPSTASFMYLDSFLTALSKLSGGAWKWKPIAERDLNGVEESFFCLRQWGITIRECYWDVMQNEYFIPNPWRYTSPFIILNIAIVHYIWNFSYNLWLVTESYDAYYFSPETLALGAASFDGGFGLSLLFGG